MSLATPTTPNSGPSLVPWNAPASNGLAIVCIPWAGAGAAPFRSWGPLFGAVATVYGARLAGRENRHAEPVAETSDQVVAEIISELTSLGVPRIALFGQCSGALLAYGLARKLAESGQGLEVEHLIVASQLPPSVFPEVDLDLGQDLTQYVPEDFRDEPEFVDMMLPVIAADMKLVSDFAYSADVPLQVPITVVYGDRDQMLGRPEVEDWCRETTGPVNFHEISDGDHLISGPAWLKLAKTIRAVLA